MTNVSLCYSIDASTVPSRAADNHGWILLSIMKGEIGGSLM